jgi:hypothetical protein
VTLLSFRGIRSDLALPFLRGRIAGEQVRGFEKPIVFLEALLGKHHEAVLAMRISLKNARLRRWKSQSHTGRSCCETVVPESDAEATSAWGTVLMRLFLLTARALSIPAGSPTERLRHVALHLWMWFVIPGRS